MAQVELVMPKMGESIMEATILKWHKQVGDSVEEDETILEIATDKVDSEVPSPTSGVIKEILFEEDSVVEIGKAIAVIATEGEAATEAQPAAPATTNSDNGQSQMSANGTQSASVPYVPETSPSATSEVSRQDSAGRFYSPLVRNIAKEEGIGMQELEQIPGTGANGRVTKHDMLSYVEQRQSKTASPKPSSKSAPTTPSASPPPAPKSTARSASAVTQSNGNVEIVEMDRMRKLIADHMVNSKHTSPHVTSFIEADVTNIVNWRNANKRAFQNKYGEKITYTPIFVEAIAKAIRDFPMINVSVDGTNILVKKDINVGMATALPSGNLIVPVIKNADQRNLLGLTKAVNDLANRARNNKLKPEEIQEGTFTLTNVGTFGNVMGTPIINQPQVAIMAAGAIRKKPAVIETEYGDVIAIRQLMFLSLSYDHRVVDGFLGGSFLRRVGDYLEAFDHTQTI